MRCTTCCAVPYSRNLCNGWDDARDFLADLLGPFWPPIFTETAREVGGSAWVWYIVMAIARATSGAFLVDFSTGTVEYMKMYLDTPWLFLKFWIAIINGAVFLLLALYSLYCSLVEVPSNVPAKVLGPLYFVAASLALFMPFSHEWYLFDNAITMSTPIFFGIDLALGTLVRFRLSYLLLPQVVLIINTVLRHIYNVPYRLVDHAILLGMSCATFALYRLTAICFPIRNYPQDESTQTNPEEESVVEV